MLTTIVGCSRSVQYRRPLWIDGSHQEGFATTTLASKLLTQRLPVGSEVPDKLGTGCKKYGRRCLYIMDL